MSKRVHGGNCPSQIRTNIDIRKINRAIVECNLLNLIRTPQHISIEIVW